MPRFTKSSSNERMLRGPEILYLDDRAENVAAGAGRGWQVILQQDPARTLEQVRRLGLPDQPRDG